MFSKLTMLVLAGSIAASAQCPIANIEVGTKMLFGVKTPEGRIATQLTLRYTNTSTKTIVGAKFLAGWRDATGDTHPIIEALLSDGKVKPNAVKKESWAEPYSASESKGWVLVPLKILYEDGSTWQNTGDKTCFGQKAFEIPALKEAPESLTFGGVKK